MDTNYYSKYLKYKEKYLKLKFQHGGIITKTVIMRDTNNNYVVLLDNNTFLKFNLLDVNLAQLDNYVKACCQDSKAIYNYINNHLTEKFVYLSNFYTLSVEEHKKINQNIKIEKLKKEKELETKIFDNEVKIKDNTFAINSLSKYNLLLKKNNNTEKLQINTKRIDDKTAENLSLNENIDKLKLELSKVKSKSDINVSIFDKTDITTNDIKGIAGQILLYVLNSLYGNEINLCLEPILGDNPKSLSYANIDKTPEQRYNDLIKYYETVLYKSTNVKSNSKTTFEQFNDLGGDITMFSYIRSFDRIFMIGKVNLSDIRTIVIPETYKTIELIKWGFGIENEVGIIAGQTATNLNTHNTEEKVTYTFMNNFDNLIRTTNNYVTKQKIQKILGNSLAYLEGNSSNDVMLESTTILPINKTLDDYINEINDERKGNLEAYNKIFKTSVKYYNGEPYKSLVNNRGEHYDYLGSYHFNITLPHSQNISISEPDEVFLKRHLDYARLLQWFEPLLLAVYGQPDYRSIYDKKKYSQASYRLFNSKSMFINTSDLTTNIPPSREIPETNTQLLEKRNKFINKIRQELSYDFRDTRGYDFRRAGYEPGKEYKSKYYGFEFRLMDYFPIENLKQFCELLWLLAFKLDTRENTIDIENAAYNDVVVEQIKYIINSGWNSEICDTYHRKMRELCTTLGLLGEIDTKNAYEMLNSIYILLLRNYNNYNFTNNNVINSYNIILGNLKLRMLECPNKIAKNKLIEYQINLLFNNNKNLGGQNRDTECQSVESLKDVLSEMCGIYMSYGEMNEETKRKFKKTLVENKNVSKCLINNPDDIDIDNIYYYIEYIYNAGKCQ